MRLKERLNRLGQVVGENTRPTPKEPPLIALELLWNELEHMNFDTPDYPSLGLEVAAELVRNRDAKLDLRLRAVEYINREA